MHGLVAAVRLASGVSGHRTAALSVVLRKDPAGKEIASFFDEKT
jgi:hypothetical protein